MSYLIVCIEKPNEKDGQKWNDWFSFLNDLKDAPKLKEAGERLLDTLWQFPAPSALLSANRLLAIAQNRGLNSKMFYSDSKIEECK